MLPPKPSITVLLNFALLVTFLSLCSTLTSPSENGGWNYVVDPYVVQGIMNFTPFLGMRICENGTPVKRCTEDFAAALKKGNTLVKKDDALRKGCDYDDYLQRKVCWIRKLSGSAIPSMRRTKFELQFWFDHKYNRSFCRYNYPHAKEDDDNY
uniref:Uncharacterized protein n=1 Tax=Cacopsylla melanoneura TaxID=428564 RepID=A0A8D9DYR5_9HEMI